MKFVLFVEGQTEKKAVPAFLKRWLDTRLNQRVGIKPVRYHGWTDMIDDLPKKADMYLNGSTADDIIAVIALLDLYGPTFYPSHLELAQERLEWARKELEKRVNHDRFRMFFAVHELEAWLLSDPNIFPSAIKSAFPGKIGRPEEVNFDEPPSKLLDKLYEEKTKSKYKKITHGKDLFDRLDPDSAYQKCPYLRMLLNTLLQLAQDKGL